jgi:ADP-ribosyl-[dinitrogen reductase] hydrolase
VIDEAILDRGIGALLGLAVGDALGTTLEFKRRDTVPPLTDIVGGGPFHLRPGEWTDDTSMALCLADSLLACDGLDQRDLMDRFVRWYRDGENSVNGRCFDIGIQTSEALERYERTGIANAGPTDPAAGGNGSIMRLAPVPLRWHDDVVQAREAARDQSRTTHAAPEPVEACALLAEILVDAIVTGDKEYVLRQRDAVEPKIAAIAHGNWRRPRDEIRSSGYVVDTLEAALWAVSESSSFEQAALLAVNLACDADTVGAVTGQIAGALWGRSGIPQRWLDLLNWREDIEDRARRLLMKSSK